MIQTRKMSNHHHSSSFPSCFRPNSTTSAASNHRSAAAAHCSGNNPNLTTCLYHTHLGLFALTWSRNLLGSSLHLHLLLQPPHSAADDDHNLSLPSLPSLPTPSFHLQIKPFFFWTKQGSKKLNLTTDTTQNIQIFWDLSKAKFGSGPEPQSGFYIAVVVSGEMTLLVGDSPNEAYYKIRAKKPEKPQNMVLRREHVYGNKLYTTKANFGGKTREISIDCRVNDDPRLCFSIDHNRVLQIKHLKWKFRGNERIEADGVHIQVSWDVYNWLFEEDDQDGYALFMFRFEKTGLDEDVEDDDYEMNHLKEKNGMALWSHQSCGFGFEKKKMKKGVLRSSRSSSSSSLSSASSGCSSVMEWASMEENELKGPSGFSLLVYAWKS
ncbi:uncharacterized protein LOC132284729 [Cornus florida]|uniref:uncharacterized protein LOC132284729 n=1 Tax=Cornus florida TaxID=4283 RepID=UPI0028A26965|nr:uncharacterized protein LOC132284729 [Cornus florida]